MDTISYCEIKNNFDWYPIKEPIIKWGKDEDIDCKNYVLLENLFEIKETISKPFILSNQKSETSYNNGRLISTSEALKLSHKILEDAEKERLLIAEREATIGIPWDKL